MTTIKLEDVTSEAVQAALDVLDTALANTSKKSYGPCGDTLAYKLHGIIKSAIEDHFESDYAPAFISLDKN